MFMFGSQYLQFWENHNDIQALPFIPINSNPDLFWGHFNHTEVPVLNIQSLFLMPKNSMCEL